MWIRRPIWGFKQNKERLWDSGGADAGESASAERWQHVPGGSEHEVGLAHRDYIVAVVQDISERKKNEAALHSSGERLRACIDNTPMWPCSGLMRRPGALLEQGLGKYLRLVASRGHGKTTDQFDPDVEEAVAFLRTLQQIGSLGPIPWAGGIQVPAAGWQCGILFIDPSRSHFRRVAITSSA